MTGGMGTFAPDHRQSLQGGEVVNSVLPDIQVSQVLHAFQGSEITHKVVDGALWVDHVTVTPDSWDELGTSKPARFTIYVHTNEAWSSAGKDAVIVVRLHADRDAQTIFTIKSQCKPEPPEKSDKPNKPDKSDKSPKPKKRKKSFYDPGIDASRPGEARSILSQGEV